MSYSFMFLRQIVKKHATYYALLTIIVAHQREYIGKRNLFQGYLGSKKIYAIMYHSLNHNFSREQVNRHVGLPLCFLLHIFLLQRVAVEQFFGGCPSVLSDLKSRIPFLQQLFACVPFLNYLYDLARTKISYSTTEHARQFHNLILKDSVNCTNILNLVRG